MAKLTGFSEAAEPFAETTLGSDGRILIPAALRDAAGIKRGEAISIRAEEGRIVIESFAGAIRRIREKFAGLRRPGESVVDEFIAEKRAEAAREDHA